MKFANSTKALKAAHITVNAILVLLIGCLLYFIRDASVACSIGSKNEAYPTTHVIKVSEVKEYYKNREYSCGHTPSRCFRIF